MKEFVSPVGSGALQKDFKDREFIIITIEPECQVSYSHLYRFAIVIEVPAHRLASYARIRGQVSREWRIEIAFPC